MISSAHAIDIIFQHFQGVRNWKRANEEDEKIEMEYMWRMWGKGCAFRYKVWVWFTNLSSF